MRQIAFIIVVATFLIGCFFLTTEYGIEHTFWFEQRSVKLEAGIEFAQSKNPFTRYDFSARFLESQCGTWLDDIGGWGISIEFRSNDMVRYWVILYHCYCGGQ